MWKTRGNESYSNLPSLSTTFSHVCERPSTSPWTNARASGKAQPWYNLQRQGPWPVPSRFPWGSCWDSRRSSRSDAVASRPRYVKGWSRSELHSECYNTKGHFTLSSQQIQVTPVDKAKQAESGDAAAASKIVPTRPVTSFAPRVLMRNKAPVPRLAVDVAAASNKEGQESRGGGDNSKTSNKALSNDDFRKMFS